MAGFQLDHAGEVPTKPLTGWSISHVAASALLLTIEYAETEEKFQRGEHSQMTFALTPQGALNLANALKTHSQNLVDSLLPAGVQVH